MSSHQHRWKVDKNLIPLKAHYFLHSAGLGAIWPFVPVLGRQLGITPFYIGLIFAISTLLILVVKPLAKLFKNQKTVFIIAIFVVVLSLLSFTIFPQPDINAARPVQFECGRGSNYLKQCSANANRDKEKLNHDPLVCPTIEQRGWIERNENSTTKYIPDYIENDELRHQRLLGHIHGLSQPTSQKPNAAKKSKRAAVETPEKGQGDVPLKSNSATSTAAPAPGIQDDFTTKCYISCEAIEFHRMEHFCANFIGKKHISAELCTLFNSLAGANRTVGVQTQEFLYYLYFETTIKISETHVVNDCLFLPIDTISFKSVQRQSLDEVTNATLTRNDTLEPDQLPFEKFACLPEKSIFDTCFANCPKDSFGLHLNQYLEVYSPVEHELFSTAIRFWLFVIVAALGIVALGVVNSINDSICSQLVYDNPDKYGLQRLWAVAGFGIFCLFSGYFIDRISDSKIAKDYAGCFFLVAGLYTLDFVVSFRLEIKASPKYQTIRNSLSVLRDPRISLFIIDCLFLGICSGVHKTYFLWYIEELNEKRGCTGASDWIRTIQGFLVFVQSFSEILYFSVAGWLLNKFGYFNCLSLVLLMSSIQYAMYCLLSHPWSFLPLEVFQGIIHSMFFSTMINYGSVAVSLSGRQNTPRVKQFFSIAFNIIGMSIGAILGGYLFEEHGGQMMFGVLAVSCLIFFFLHTAVVFVMNKKIDYGQPIMIISTSNNTTTSTNEQKLKRISRSDSQEFHFDFESDID